MPFSDKIYLHSLNLLPFLGARRLTRLYNYFGSYKEAYEASLNQLISSGLDLEQCNELIIHRQKISLEFERENLSKNNIELYSKEDDAYPYLLSQIPDPPAILYVRGALPPKDSLMISVVGTRNISTYGRTVTPELIRPLIQSGIIIVSGLAFGVDALAHQTCLDESRPTIAVLGSGVDEASVYPRAHSLLSDQILENGGALISEYSPGTISFKEHFVARNRIISGLSVGTLIVEAGFKSGALITAKHALDQNRNVYAVPGPIYSSGSEGPNNLIKLGAKLVSSPSDILEDLQVSSNTATINPAPQDLSSDEKTIFDLLTFEPQGADELIRASSLDAQTISTTLTYLEIKGLIRNLGAGQYVRAKIK